MSWKCPQGCHEQSGFRVTQNHTVQDEVVHVYAADDIGLDESLNHKVYEGDTVGRGDPCCSICESFVEHSGLQQLADAEPEHPPAGGGGKKISRTRRLENKS